MTVRFWASVDAIHLLIGGACVKTLRSHLSAADLEQLARNGAIAAGSPPLPAAPADSDAVEVDRTVSSAGIVSLAAARCSPPRSSPAGASRSASSPPR